MRRVSSEILVVGVAMVAMATMVLVFGAVVLPEPAPPMVVGGAVSTGASECIGAAATALQGSAIAGHGWLCGDEAGVRPRVRLTGLTPGLEYSVWLSYTTRVFADPPTSSGTIVWRGGAVDGPPRLVGQGTAPRTGELESRGDFPDLRISSPVQVTLIVLQPGGPTGPHAQVVFVVP